MLRRLQLALINMHHERTIFLLYCYASLILHVTAFRHLDGAVLETLSRPHLLITDAYNALNVQARRKERDQALLS